MKKILSLLLAIVISVSILSLTVSGTAEFAVPEIGFDAMINGGFESVTGASADGWNYSPGNWGSSQLRLENNSSYVHSGTYSARLAGRQHVEREINLITGATYTLSFWVYNQSSSNGVRCYYSYDSDLDGIRHYSDLVTASNVWTKCEIDVTAPYGCNSISFDFYRSGSEGYSYLDDISLTLKSKPPKYRLNPRDVFNYSDEETGEISLVINDELVADSEAGATLVDFTILNDYGDVLYSKKSVRCTEYEAKYVYSLTKLDLKKKYTVRAEVKYNGSIVQTLTETVYKYPRPTHLRRDGVYIDHDGKPFAPLFAYDPGRTRESLAKLAEGGINTVYVSWFSDEFVLEMLQWCNELGLKAIVDFGVSKTFPSHTTRASRVSNLIKVIRDDPALLAYALMDEPDAQSTEGINGLRSSYILLREHDDDHPVFICQYDFLGINNVYEVTGKYCDILAYDRYPGYGVNSTQINQVAKKTIAAVEGRKPVWAVIKSNDYEQNGTAPTADNIRDHFYRAMQEGVKGIGYYSLCLGPESNYVYNTETWEPLKAFGNNEQKLALDYFVNGKYERFFKIDEGSPSGFFAESFWVGNDLYLIAQNRFYDTVSRNVDLISSDGNIAISAFSACKYVDGVPSSTVIKSESSTLSLTLQGCEAVLYKITPLDGQNFEGLTAGNKTGWYGAAITNNSSVSTDRKEFHLNDATAINEAGKGAEGDDVYISLPNTVSGSQNASYLEYRAKVTPGKNYVVTFWTKSSVANAFHGRLSYEIFNESGTLLDWSDASNHVTINNCTNRSADDIDWLNAPMEHGNSVMGCTSSNVWHEGAYCFNLGIYADAQPQWIKNQFEIHVPHCADVLNFKVWASHNASASGDRFIDNFSIEEVPTNLILNGDFDYTANKELKGMADTDVLMRASITGWEVFAAGDVKINKNTENNNTYYSVDCAGTDVNSGDVIGQYVTLDPGTYKLSYDRKNIDGHSNEEWGYLSIVNQYPANRLTGIVDPKEPGLISGNEITQFIGNQNALDYNNENYCTIPVTGCSLYPRVIGSQKSGDGWQRHDVYFEVTQRRLFLIAFGNRYHEYGKFAIDNVELLPLSDDPALSIVESAEVTSEDISYYSSSGTPASTWHAEANVQNITSLDQGTNIQSLLSYKSTSPVEGVLVTAIYKKLDNNLLKLKSADCAEFTFPANKVSLKNSETLNVPSDGDYTVKAFVWDSLSKLKPLLGIVTLE